jgi:hypothetical protein
MLEITSAKLTGNPAGTGWSQVYDFAPEDPEKLKVRGHLYAVISTSRQEEGIDKVVAGRELLTRLHEEYFGKLEGSSFNALKIAVEKVIGEFDPIWGDVEIAAVALLGDVVYSVAAGGAQVSILRNGMFAKILISKKGEVTNASGYPNENDVIVLGSRRFYEDLTDMALKQALELETPEVSLESLASSLTNQAHEGNIGAFILKFKKEKLFAPALGQPVQVATEGGEVGNKIPFGAKVTSFFTGLKRFSGEVFDSIGKKLPERRIYIKGLPDEEVELPKKSRTTLSVGAILLVLLLVSIGFGIRAKKIKDEKAKYQGTLTQAIQLYDSAVGLYTSDLVQARASFIQSITLVNQMQNQGVKDAKLDELVKNIAGKEGSILGKYTQEPKLFMDLSLLSSGFVGDSLSFTGTKLFVLDKIGKKIVGIATDTKKTEVVAGPDLLSDVASFASYEDKVFAVTGTGIDLIGTTKTEVIKKDWTGEVLIKAYTGNIYLLDKAANMIWRYQGTGNTFGSKSRWLAPGITTDFSLVKQMVIDGSIWVLTSSGKMLRFSSGSPQVFTPQGVSPELTSYDLIYTNENDKSVYILDKVGKRIIAFDKNGTYIAQYLADSISQTKDFIVSEVDKKIILLIDSKLYSIDLLHL